VLLLTRPAFCLVFAWLAMAGVCFAQPVANSDSAPHKAPESVVILVPPTVLDTLKVFLRPGETPDTFDDFAREGNYRDLTDYLLLRRALVVGGNTLPIVIEPWLDVSYDRVILRLRAGHAAVFSNGIWREDIPLGDAQLKISPPLFEYGEMEAGIYMSPHNQKLHTTKTRADVQKLSAVSSKQWRPDWIALQQLGLERLYDNVYWESMLKMVRSERVDFMLIGFSNSKDLSYNAVGISLKPVPNMKVKLAGSRGWVISQTNPQGPSVYAAVEKGLGILRTTGVIKRAYRDAGVINAAVENWLVLNPMEAGLTAEKLQ
jgi:hypothetical protein